MSQYCEMQGCQCYGVKRIKLYFRKQGIVEKSLGYRFITLSSSHFINKTDFEQYFFKHDAALNL